MCKHIVNRTAQVAYDLGDVDFKPAGLYSRFRHSELTKLPESYQSVIKANLLVSDVLTYEALTPQEKALYTVVAL
ncbi:hypothetical protein QX220_06185 [Vibrio vulnificus]|uniref:hypothetical protein n=1 Tax=Vibrio TaxID=662 RepID=UPI000C7A17F5|nr:MULTISPECIES: hypothetical protein [Vibrio]AUJ37440.1 hypothetical protein BWZ32_21760 [Vibrio vulnificus]MDS1861228.1 hypothetical protein [Vibrio vulnificus]HCG9749824.1 hypothetical protein [Vibrio parahaemolyticus]HDY7968049.1 hypothetical protein [Vibrio vulnificus]